MGRADRQTAHLDQSRAQPAQPFRRRSADGEQGDDRRVAESREREPQGADRRSIEPLEVVDRDAERAVGRELADRPQERGRNDVLVDGGVGLAQEQSRLERATLHRRQPRNDVVDHLGQEIREPGVRVPGLGLARPRCERPDAALRRGLDPGRPQLRLADAGIAGKNDRTGRGVRGVEHTDDVGQLVLSADEVPDRSAHVCHSAPRNQPPA